MIGELIRGMLSEAFEGTSTEVKRDVAGAYNMSFLGSVDSTGPKVSGR